MGKEETVIIGAGPAGMACAMELFKKNKNFTIIEKDSKVGGLSKTYEFGEFKTDNGPHRFFSKNKYLYEFIENILGEKWIKVRRHTRFYIQGKFYKYPVEIKNVLLNIGFFKSVKVLTDYVLSKIKYRKKEWVNFEEYALATFGKTLAELNILNYTEKIWGIPCTEISVDWANQRIKNLNLMNIMKKYLGIHNGSKSLVEEFYYPAEGTGLIYDSILDKVKKKNKILLNEEPKKIILSKNKIKEIHIKSGKKIKTEQVVSSIPITRFIELIEPKADKKVLQAAKNLRYRSQVYLFLTINRERITKDQWIYFPDKEIPFGRISEMKNFSSVMSPKGKTSLFIEFFCWEGDNIWKMNKEELFEFSIKWLERLKFVSRKDIVDKFLIKKNYVYPVYDLNYKKNLEILENYLNNIENLTYIGRPGRFRYTNQDHSLEMGISAARNIIENKKPEIENIYSEDEYLEEVNTE
jgi:protoporphyrinogen oxidase